MLDHDVNSVIHTLRKHERFLKCFLGLKTSNKKAVFMLAYYVVDKTTCLNIVHQHCSSLPETVDAIISILLENSLDDFLKKLLFGVYRPRAI